MTTITIPKTLTQKGDLVVISKKEYEKMKTQIIPTFYLKGKSAKKLDRRVNEGLKEYRRGKTETLRSFLKKEYPHLSSEYGD